MSPPLSSPTGGRAARSANRAAARRALRLGALLVAALAVPARGFDLVLATENDFLAGANRDDLYTFSVALTAERGPYELSLRENAFTDREAGTRFDETHLTARRAVAGLRSWSLHAEAGVAHVGRGLFGEEAQNSLHRLLGDEELDLRYLDSRLYPTLGLEAERAIVRTAGLDLGLRLEAEAVPGFRSHAVVGLQATRRTGLGVTLHLFAGARLTHAALAPLAGHVEPLAPNLRVGLVLRDRYFVSWTYNEYGVEREHLSVGLRVAGRLGTGPESR